MGGKPARYVTDEQGNPVAVIVSLGDYRRMLEALEELESIRAYDAAKASGDETVDFEAAVQEIEERRGG
ncbi:type II toxin-antitoxin system Phd/YefM family antitoxin [Deferrisoma camini]|uniref:type II toxin-antitoxin system Phd/YefM family antitoxin n=1 Tax=Deferrisoma camini TaxID=1035120 RepID=UPI00046D51D3|nr:type II toxin-antitoxin system Phd/YefM family antitoxin [Deferrisoma camini]